MSTDKCLDISLFNSQTTPSSVDSPGKCAGFIASWDLVFCRVDLFLDHDIHDTMFPVGHIAGNGWHLHYPMGRLFLLVATTGSTVLAARADALPALTLLASGSSRSLFVHSTAWQELCTLCLRLFLHLALPMSWISIDPQGLCITGGMHAQGKAAPGVVETFSGFASASTGSAV